MQQTEYERILSGWRKHRDVPIVGGVDDPSAYTGDYLMLGLRSPQGRRIVERPIREV